MLNLALAIAVIAVLVVYLPYPALLINSYFPWKFVHTPTWKAIMDFRRSFREDREPVPLPEIDMKDITKEKFLEMTGE